MHLQSYIIFWANQYTSSQIPFPLYSKGMHVRLSGYSKLFVDMVLGLMKKKIDLYTHFVLLSLIKL